MSNYGYNWDSTTDQIYIDGIGTTDSTTGNSIWITDHTTTTMPYIFTDSTNTGSIVFSPPDTNKYQSMQLPRDEMPIAVYVAGRMVTLGIIGTDVEAMYMGEDKLMFKPGVVGLIQLGDKITLIIDYKDETYHYNIPSNWEEVIEPELLSVIQK